MSFGSIVRGILITLALLALAIAGFVHYGIIKPVAERTAIEHPDDLAFVAGFVAFSCILPDFAEHADDIAATVTMAEKLKDRGKECKSSISSFVDCAVDLTDTAIDEDKREHALQQTKTAKRAYDAGHKILSDAKKIALNLPAYDDKTKAAKAALIKTITHFAQMDMLDILFLDEDEQDAWGESALAPYDTPAFQWLNDAEALYDDLESLVGLTWKAYQISPALSSMIMWDLNQYGFDEIMQRAPAFKFARQNGCLQGATLLDATMQFIAKLEDLIPQFQKLAELTTAGPNCEDGSIQCE